MSKSTLFIVGMPRSGTKLLRDLLNQHSRIAIFPNETHFFPYLDRVLPDFGDLTEEDNFKKFYAVFTSSTFYKRIVKKGVVIDYDEFYKGVKSSTLSSVLESLFDCYRSYTGKPIVGDKTPSYLTQIPLLSKTFPEAKYVFIYRDPRDYALSINMAWGKNKYRAVQRWKNQIEKFNQDVTSANLNYYSLSYEDLVGDPEPTMRELLAYLSLDFEESVLSLSAPSENLGDAQGAVTIVNRNYDKWKGILAHKEVVKMESIAGSLMVNLGYEVENVPGSEDISKLSMLYYKICDAYNLFRFHVSEEGGIVPAIKEIRRATLFSGINE